MAKHWFSRRTGNSSRPWSKREECLRPRRGRGNPMNGRWLSVQDSWRGCSMNSGCSGTPRPITSERCCLLRPFPTSPQGSCAETWKKWLISTGPKTNRNWPNPCCGAVWNCRVRTGSRIQRGRQKASANLRIFMSSTATTPWPSRFMPGPCLFLKVSLMPTIRSWSGCETTWPRPIFTRGFFSRRSLCTRSHCPCWKGSQARMIPLSLGTTSDLPILIEHWEKVIVPRSSMPRPLSAVRKARGGKVSRPERFP